MPSPNYSYLSNGELDEGLRAGLSPERRAAVQNTVAWTLYAADVLGVASALASLPPELKLRPLADLMGEADGDHDDQAEAGTYLCQAVLLDRKSAPAQRDTARLALRELLPAARERGATYAAEVQRVRTIRPLVEQHAAALAELPLPGGRSLLNLLNEHIEAGLRLGDLVAQRGDIVAGVTNAQVGDAVALRGRALTLLRKFRHVLNEEAATKPAVAEAEGSFFGSLDQLAQLAFARRASKNPRQGSDTAA